MHGLLGKGSLPVLYCKLKCHRYSCSSCIVSQTMVCSGSCPYNDRCVFLHDPRIKINKIKLKPLKLVRTQQSHNDNLYWPDMQRTQIHRTLDRQGLPDANQMYLIPDSFAASTPRLSLSLSLGGKRSYFHDRAVYSLWTHFIDFCCRTNGIPLSAAVQTPKIDPTINSPRNAFIPSMRRLRVFVKLATETPQTDHSLDSIMNHQSITGRARASTVAERGEHKNNGARNSNTSSLEKEVGKMNFDLQPLTGRLAMESTSLPLRDDWRAPDSIKGTRLGNSQAFVEDQDPENMYLLSQTLGWTPSPHSDEVPEAGTAPVAMGPFGLYLDNTFFKK
jgi:hypothetical protein